MIDLKISNAFVFEKRRKNLVHEKFISSHTLNISTFFWMNVEFSITNHKKNKYRKSSHENALIQSSSLTDKIDSKIEISFSKTNKTLYWWSFQWNICYICEFMSELHVENVWRDQISLISIDARFELFTKWNEFSLIIIIWYNQTLFLIFLK